MRIRRSFFIGCPFKGKLVVDFFQQRMTDGMHPLTRDADVPRDGCLPVAFEEHFISDAVRFGRKTQPPRCFHEDSTRHMATRCGNSLEYLAHPLAP